MYCFADAGAVYSPPNRHCEIVRFERQIKKGRSEANRQHLYYRTSIARGLKNEIHGVEEKRKKKKDNTAIRININQKGRLLTNDNLCCLLCSTSC